MGQTVGRFAPTPSGRMHLGNMFSGLLAWLSCRAAGGHMVLRIEDLDLQRTSPEYTRLLMEDLRWLGLDWDEGPDTGGKSAPYLQSQRGAFYNECIAALEAKGLVYPCFCSRAQLHAANAPHAEDGSYVYNRRCLSLTAAQRAEEEKRRPGALRVQVPEEIVAIPDGCQGLYSESLARHAGDFILRRSDGVFAYQLCAPADDGAMGITEVVRGRDLLSSAPRQAWLMRTLGYPVPRFCHTPMLLAPDGRRLAKRDRDLDMGALRQNGARPEAVAGVLCWLAGLMDTPEAVKPADMAPHFSWGSVRREDVRVTQEVLDRIMGL